VLETVGQFGARVVKRSGGLVVWFWILDFGFQFLCLSSSHTMESVNMKILL